MPDTSPSDLLTLPEASSVLRLRVSTIRAWILKRRVPHVKLGGRVFLRRGDVLALIGASLVPAKLSERTGDRTMPHSVERESAEAAKP